MSRFSVRTLRAFAEAVASNVALPQIDAAFHAAGIEKKAGYPVGSSGRRGVFLAYVAAEPQIDARSVVRLADALGGIVSTLDSDGALDAANELRAEALRDGFAWVGSRFETAAPHVALYRSIEELDLADLPGEVQRLYELCETRPQDAIGGATDLVESACKTILRLAGDDVTSMEIPALKKAALSRLNLVPNDVDDGKKGAEAIRVCLGHFSEIPVSLARLRNLYGSGHGRDGSWVGLSPRHARLAVGAAATFVAFVAETYEVQRTEPGAVVGATGSTSAKAESSSL
jgi:hypothetical protein